MKNTLLQTTDNIKEILRRISGGNVANTAIERAANERRYKVALFYRAMLTRA